VTERMDSAIRKYASFDEMKANEYRYGRAARCMSVSMRFMSSPKNITR
jgi:hypothetical protein